MSLDYTTIVIEREIINDNDNDNDNDKFTVNDLCKKILSIFYFLRKFDIISNNELTN